MDDKRIAEIRARVEAATAPPWGVWTGMDNTLDVLSEAMHPALPLLSFYGNDQPLPSLQEKLNAEFVAASRQDVPDLLAALDAARADVARLREGIIAVAKHLDSGVDLGLSHNYSLVAAQQLEDLAATEAQP